MKNDSRPETTTATEGAVNNRRRSIVAGIGAAGIVAGVAPFNILRAQGRALKVGVLLPRSGVQAGIGQDCQRGVDLASGIFRISGCRISKS